MTTLSKPMKKFSPVAQAAMDFYQSQAMQLLNQESERFLSLRQNALAQFMLNGFPTRKDEDWQFTPLSGFLNTHYSAAPQTNVNSVPNLAVKLPFEALHLVFVDGRFNEVLSSDLTDLPKGLSIKSVLQDTDLVDVTADTDDAFVMLNSMLFNEGVSIELASGLALEMPIALDFIQTRKDSANTIRNQVTLGEGASLHLYQQHIAEQGVAALDNLVTKVTLEKRAQLQQIVWQDLDEKAYYFSNQFVDLKSSALFKSHYIGLGGAISRHQNQVYMNGEHIESEQNSICFARNQQVMDTRTYTGHNAEDGISRQLHKLVLNDQAVGVFNGMIKVAQAAQKTDGMMDNKNLLLSNEAQMNAKPQLEIYADDVKCSHGSASGQISADQIFYLQARGLSKQQARQLVTLAFLMEPLETMSHSKMQAWLQQRLSNAVTPYL